MKKNKKTLLYSTVLSLFLGIIVFLIIEVMLSVSLAQTNDLQKKSSDEVTKEKILEKQAFLREEIQKVNTAIALQAREQEQELSPVLEQKLEILQKIDLVYEQQLLQIKRSSDLMQTLEQLQAELSSGIIQKTLPDAASSFLFFDELQEKLMLLDGQQKSIEDTFKSADDSLQAAKEKLNKTGQNLRRIKEELEAEKKEAQTSDPYLLAELSNRLAGEEVLLRKLTLENGKLERDIHQRNLELLRKKLSLVASRIQFTKKELEEQLFRIEEEVITLKKNLEEAKAKEDLANSRWLNAKKQLVEKSLSPGEAEKTEEDLKDWKAWNDTYHLEAEILSKNINYLDAVKKVWTNRYALFNRTDSLDLSALKKEVKQSLEELQRESRLLMTWQTDCLNTIVSLEKELGLAQAASKPALHIEKQLKAFKTKENLLKKGLENIQSTQREYQKLENEIAIREKHKSIAERLSSVWIIIGQVWRYELTKVEDHPITVGKIIIAVVLLVAGFIFSKRLSIQIGNQLIKRFSMDQAAAFAFQQILHYLLLVSLVLFVLSLVRIPLTFFTVLGGALAIGVGFGSQNIVNNFLSGLILMMERPIKIGDIVEVENVQGTVEWVGARSTRIKTFGNLRLVIPNSTLLQNKVINWSLTDDIVRREIVVGVVYGSPVRMVERLVKQAAIEHSLVEKYPSPFVLFEDFGDNSLIFTLIIWISMARTGRAQIYIRQVESDIRFRIDELFRENHIIIAFPQRDVHLDTLKPLEIKLKKE